MLVCLLVARGGKMFGAKLVHAVFRRKEGNEESKCVMPVLQTLQAFSQQNNKWEKCE